MAAWYVACSVRPDFRENHLGLGGGFTPPPGRASALFAWHNARRPSVAPISRGHVQRRPRMLAFALVSCGLADALLAGLTHQACGKTYARHTSAIACDSWLGELRALRVNELKSQLSAAGVTTAGMFEKEELVAALLAVQPAAPPPFYEAALKEEDGGLYTSITNGQGEALRLMVDTGTARSVLSSRQHGNAAAAELDCPSLGLIGLDCAVADLPSYVLPSLPPDVPAIAAASQVPTLLPPTKEAPAPACAAMWTASWASTLYEASPRPNST